MTTNCAGMKEMLGDNDEYGIITDNNEDALYNGLKRIVSDPTLLDHYRAKAQERGTFFSPQQTVTAFERLIEKVIHE